MNAEELISLILDNDKIKNGKAFGDKVYRDEPILRTAADLKKEKQINEPASDRISQMRQLAYTSNPGVQSDVFLFITQAKMMADYEEKYPLNDELIVSLYMPTYRSLTTMQLRMYFGWRADVRAGREVPAVDTFIRLYAFELINLIGVDSPENAFDKLLDLWKRFHKNCCGDSLTEWLCDMAAFYRLPDEYCDKIPCLEYDKALISMLNCKTADNDKLFAAAVKLGDYKLADSLSLKKAPDDFKGAVCAVIRAFSESYGANHFVSTFFGYMLSHSTEPFRSAVFYHKPRRESFEYRINDVRIYICDGGYWQLKYYYVTKSAMFGAVMRTADSLVRERLGIKRAIKKGKTSTGDEGIIVKALDDYFEEKRRASMPKIEIDRSKLGEIRRIADITRDRLIVEEEMTETEPPAEEQPVIQPETASSADEVVEDSLPLTSGEKAFVRALLYGTSADIRAAASYAGSMPSLLADSVNEKLFDMFGDTVIEFDGDDPTVIEDYVPELKGKIL
ncbi:MAG: TerB N-terminal domain-containing protein [Ruminococcus sp.]|nr:TerB N-terminal domain-containing protein [Ruminococcus sp.]